MHNYQVLVVMDPDFAVTSVQEAYGCAEWVTHDYPREMAERLLSDPVLVGLIFPGESCNLRRRRPGFRACLLHEKVGDV